MTPTVRRLLVAEHSAFLGRQRPRHQPRSALPDVDAGMSATALPAPSVSCPLPGYAPTRPALTLSAVDTTALPTDEALMLAWAAGDVQAFQALYERHRRRLFGFLVKQLRDGPLAEELFQDVWQKVIAARLRWQPEAAFTPWLFRIAHNRLNDHWRAARHRPAAPADADDRLQALADTHTPESALGMEEERRHVQQAMEALPPEQREVLQLRLEQELTLEQIGEITGVGRETVKSRLRYAMDRLRAGVNA